MGRGTQMYNETLIAYNVLKSRQKGKFKFVNLNVNTELSVSHKVIRLFLLLVNDNNSKCFDIILLVCACNQCLKFLANGSQETNMKVR